MRKVGFGLMIGLAGLAIGASGVGVAGAATGGSFLLGRSNHETTTAALTSDDGAPLALHAAKGQPPLTVDSSVVVPRLNAARIGGLPKAALQRRLTGRCGTGIASVAPAGTVTCAARQVLFRTSTTWVVPAGVHLLGVQATGGGGGGAVATAGASRAGGGGAGAAVTEMLAVNPGERLDVVIGKGGTGATSSTAAAGGTATVIYQQSPEGQTLIDAGGGHPGRAGSGAAGCTRGSGGVPRRTSAAQPVAAVSGQPGSCGAGGGAAGWPGAGGIPSRGGSAGPGASGSVLLTLAG